MPEPKPDIVDITRIRDDRRKHRDKLISQVRSSVELYQQDYEMELPNSQWNAIHTPSTRSIPDRSADRIGSGRLQVHMEPRRAGEEEKSRVEKLEKAAVGLINLARRRTKANPIRQMALHAFTRGGFVAKVQVDLEALATMPKRGDYATERAFVQAVKLWKYQQIARFPIIIDVRPIENIFPDPETDGENDVIEYYKRRVGDVKKNYPKWDQWSSLSKMGRYTDDMPIEYTEVWTREWRGAIVEGEWLPMGDFPPGPVANPFGRPPYFLRYAGFGDASGEPQDRCVSILEAGKDVFLAQSRMLSVVDALALREAGGAMLHSSKDSAFKDSMQTGPGALVETDANGQDIITPTPFKPVNNFGELLQGLQIMKSEAESGSVPSEALGQPSPLRGRGAPSGVAAAILSGQASMIIDPVNSTIQDCLSDMIPFLFYLVDAVLEEEVPVYAQVGEDQYVQITLSPELIDGFYGPVSVRNLLRSPEDDYAKQQLGVTAKQAGYPMPWVLENFHNVENAKSVIEDMYVRQIVENPQLWETYLIPRFIEHLQAKRDGRAEEVPPGSTVPAPPGTAMPVDPMTGMPMGGAQMGPPPMDPLAAAGGGLSQAGPMLAGGAPAIATG